jgi:ferredoxin
MRQEKESAGRPFEKTPDSNMAGEHRESTPRGEKSGGAVINFHSAEFNRIDDLNDCTGNYRSFQSLDGIVTAHERHQIELRQKREDLDSAWDGPVRRRKNEVKTDDHKEILEAVAPLTVSSEGRTLIIDTDVERAKACGRTLRNHRLLCTLLITGSTLPETSGPRLGRIKLLHVDRVSITGAFGGFSATVTVGGSEKPLAEWFDDTAIFDLVLDLQPTPSFVGGRLPIGYYAPGPSPSALADALAELPEMRGQFKKPQFIAFYKSRCFHGRSRTHDCRKCLEICPVHAIRSVDHGISINHYLCQGCGGCALACPADAIRVVQPSQDELLNLLRSSLASRSAEGHSPMTLILSDSALTASDGNRGDGMICFEVEQIAYVRLGVLLAALAFGAREVVVECDPQNPLAIREAVERQVQMACAILQGLGLGEERIQFLVLPPEDPSLTKAIPHPVCIVKKGNDAPAVQAFFPSGCDGRTLVYLSAQILRDQPELQQSWLPLPMGSPFGTVVVNSDACTLCMACVAACPSGALSSGGNAPCLAFREFQCHQCGLCRETCPEDAIQLVPRLLLNHRTIESQTILREMEPFRCVECGVPFAPPAMIDRMKEKLAGHWMYASEKQLRRLQMCRTCRTRDALASQETGSWNP